MKIDYARILRMMRPSDWRRNSTVPSALTSTTLSLLPSTEAWKMENAF